MPSERESLKVVHVVGARPNFLKIAPILEACGRRGGIDSFLVHTGQHYDERMSDLFFRQLGMPAPDVNLEVGSGTHAAQTARIMEAFEPVVVAQRPDAVLVVGDVNSTIACGLVAAKLGVKLIHVEAGLRSFDRAMPEEINRVLTDAISDLLLVSEQSGLDNLSREGAARERVFLVGNVMIDSLRKHLARARELRILEDLGLRQGAYAVLTLHRPANVDDPAAMGRILGAVETIQRELPVVFPVHPRTRKVVEGPSLAGRVAAMKGLRLLDPQGYLEFLRLTSAAKVVLTDSGGIQEETTILKVPCLTLRQNTERPVTVECGGNRLVGSDPQRIIQGFRDAMDGRLAVRREPPLWDGRAAERIADIIASEL